MKKNNNPDDLIVSYILNKEDLALFYPWLFDALNIDLTLLPSLNEPKKRKGRKPKAHRSQDNEIFEGKASIN
jgi:hypothetical protein